MKNVAFLLFCIVPLMGFSQDKGTWTISSNFQTDHNFIAAKINNYFYIEPKPKVSPQFTAGIGINYRFANNFELISGVRYSQKNFNVSLGNSPYYFCGTADYDLIYWAPLYRNFIEVPLLARYYFLPGKFKLHVESGWIGSYQLEEDASFSQRSFLLGAQTGFGVNYFLNRWQISLSANHRLQFELGTRNQYYSINPHAFGFEFKTAFSLNK